jgi:uncharacterized protein (DUF2126 family)
VLSGSVLGISCSSSGDESEEITNAPQDAGPPEGTLVSPGLSEDLLVRVAEILGIDQEQVANAFEQAQSELATMSGDRQPSSAPPGDGPQEGTSPPDMPSEGMPSEDMFPGDMSPGFGLPDELLASAAEILGIDQQELADAVEQAQDEMASETVPLKDGQVEKEEKIA